MESESDRGGERYWRKKARGERRKGTLFTGKKGNNQKKKERFRRGIHYSRRSEGKGWLEKEKNGNEKKRTHLEPKGRQRGKTFVRRGNGIFLGPQEKGARGKRR